jgi:biotin carboxylase
MAQRVLVLSSTTSYRTDDFLRAAARLGVEAVLGTNRCHELAGIWPREAFGGSLPIEFRQELEAADAIVRDAATRPFDAIIATDDPTADIAARAAERLGLRGNSVGAARTARNKRLMREALAQAGVCCPRFAAFEEGHDPAAAWAALAADGWRFPVVVKPLLCSASRGVIRADDEAAFVAAWRRLAALLHTPALRAVEDPDGHRVLVESFVPGAEVALEGILRGGALTTLALFDKPDPLDGPFFEETIYVTPSRHPPAVQQAIAAAAAQAAAAIGLAEGPIHAELRLSADGPVAIEVAARSIGGLCARTLRFGLGESSLEEIVIRQALGRELGALDTGAAAGVMMIPIPSGGVLAEVAGVDAARAVPLVAAVQITARPGEGVVPLPEGAAYLGFVFARGPTPAEVEAALRRAHACLGITLTPLLPKLV